MNRVGVNEGFSGAPQGCRTKKSGRGDLPLSISAPVRIALDHEGTIGSGIPRRPSLGAQGFSGMDRRTKPDIPRRLHPRHARGLSAPPSLLPPENHRIDARLEDARLKTRFRCANTEPCLTRRASMLAIFRRQPKASAKLSASCLVSCVSERMDSRRRNSLHYLNTSASPA